MVTCGMAAASVVVGAIVAIIGVVCVGDEPAAPKLATRRAASLSCACAGDGDWEYHGRR